MAEDVRGELMAMAREARVLLARERGRGRTRVGSRPPAAPPIAAHAAPLGPGTPPFLHGEAAEALSLFDPPEGAGSAVAARGAGSGADAFAAFVPFAPRTDLPADLPSLAAAVASCRLCGLCGTRTQTVFADGSPAARLLFVGEAPGRDEDAQGLPFVGRAGQLLNRMIAAIELRREEVYICNVLKCRPPENRVPAPDEVERCRPYLEQQIALVRPALICALGLSAAQALLETKASMSSMRGKTFAYRGIPLIPTYHPAALLRNPGLKREAWIDLQRVRDALRTDAAATGAGAGRGSTVGVT